MGKGDDCHTGRPERSSFQKRTRELPLILCHGACLGSHGMRLSALAGAQATWQRQTQQAALLLPPSSPSPASPCLCLTRWVLPALPVTTLSIYFTNQKHLTGQSRACRRGASEAGSENLWGLFPVCSFLAPCVGANAGLGAKKEGHGRHPEPHTCRAGTACHHL